MRERRGGEVMTDYELAKETTADLVDVARRAKEAVLLDLPIDAEWLKAVNAEIVRRKLEETLGVSFSKVAPGVSMMVIDPSKF